MSCNSITGKVGKKNKKEKKKERKKAFLISTSKTEFFSDWAFWRFGLS